MDIFTNSQISTSAAGFNTARDTETGTIIKVVVFMLEQASKSIPAPIPHQ